MIEKTNNNKPYCLKKKRDHPGGQYQSGFDQLTGTEEYHQGATWKHFP